MTVAAVTVVVMAYNEVASLRAVVEEINGVLAALPPAKHEILIVDDGSHDGTSALADELAAERGHISVVHHNPNLGLGGVYRTGFSRARTEYLTFFPADGQFPAEIISRFYAIMPAHDLLLGFIPRDDAGHVAKALSLAEKALYRALFGPMPRFQGVFMLRSSVLGEITLVTTGRGWGVVMEMVLKVHRRGYRVASQQTPFRPRMAGHSKVNNLRSVWANLSQALVLRKNLRT